MRLAKNVYAGGRWYGPAHGNADQVPEDVAAKITNPGAWESGESPEGEPTVQSGQPGDSPSRPDRNDPKTDWVDYAVAQGFNRDEASAMTKAALVTLLSED